MRRGSGPLHARVHALATLGQFDWQAPAPQHERPIAKALLDTGIGSPSGIAQAGNSVRGEARTYFGGALTPQVYTRTPAGPNTEEHLMNAPMAVNARAAYPARGVEPKSPLMRRR